MKTCNAWWTIMEMSITEINFIGNLFIFIEMYIFKLKEIIGYLYTEKQLLNRILSKKRYILTKCIALIKINILRIVNDWILFSESFEKLIFIERNLMLHEYIDVSESCSGKSYSVSLCCWVVMPKKTVSTLGHQINTHEDLKYVVGYFLY